MVTRSRSLVGALERPAGKSARRGDSGRSILVIAPSWPHPPTWGFATRVFQLAKQLARRNRVSLLAYGGGSSARSRVNAVSIFESVQLVGHPESVRNRRQAQLDSLRSSRSFHLGAFRSDEMHAAVQAMLARRHFDIVQLESSQMGFVLPLGTVPVVLDEHNIEFLLLRRLAAVESSIPRKAYGYLEAAKARREEMRAWARSDGTVLTSDADLSVVRQAMPEKPACVVPNGVDTEYFHPSDVEPEPSTVVFTGAINYRPNTDAVVHFIREVMPRLKRLKPSARFLVVGDGAPGWVIRTAGPDVEFSGRVDDVRVPLNKAAVVVAPLRAGSGTRLKILEALAMAKPIVTTSIGCEGLSVASGEHLEIADDPDAFAQMVARLMSDRDAARDLGRQGRQLVEREYSWEVVARRLEEFHTQFIRKETRV